MKKVLMLIVILAVAGVAAWAYFGRPAQVPIPQAPEVNPPPTPPQISPPATPPPPPTININDNLDDALKDLEAIK